MTAKEARQIAIEADELNNDLNFRVALTSIQIAAKSGNLSTDIVMLADATRARLQELGYMVERKERSFKISW